MCNTDVLRPSDGRDDLRHTSDIRYCSCCNSRVVGFVHFVVFVGVEFDEVRVVVVLTEHVLLLLVLVGQRVW